MDYEQLLEDAYKNLKKSSSIGERFKMPEIKIEIIGNKTILSNFSQVSSYIRRKPENLMKFLSKELASQCKHEGDRLIFNRKILSQKVIEKVYLYIQKFVICKECKKPDTEIIKEDNLSFIHCLACGAKHSLGNI
ncbi:MAG: translation initiation factor IF-2 subunit beta [Candidatus Pacearchaeota archaeon]